MGNNLQTENGSGSAQKNFAPPSDGLDSSKRLGLKPAHLLAITLLGVFLAHIVTILIGGLMQPMNIAWHTLLDGLIMVAIIFPVLYLFSFRPLMAYLHQGEQALAELHELQLALEQRVEQRTIDLNQANHSLEIEIAERKQAEEQLRYQATLLENVSDAIIASDMDFKITSWNQAAENLYGWKAKEVIGKPVSEILQTEYIHQKPQEVTQQFKEQSIWKGEVIQKRKDGAKIDILASISHVKNNAGEPIGTVGVNRDITERKTSETEIQSLAKFPGENPNPVLRVGNDGTVLYANPSSAKLLPCWKCTVGKKLSDTWALIIAEALASGRPKEEELLCGERIFSLVIAPIPDSGYANIYGRDITDRKRTEEALRLSEDRFAKAFRSSPAAISITRLSDGRFVDVNESFIKIFGYTREELLSLSSIDLYADPNERSKLIELLLEQQSIRDYEVITRTKTGQKIHVLLSTEMIVLEGEAQILAILYDITERKRMEQAIILAKQEWERTFDAVPDLVAILDQEQNILRLNRAMAERLGRPPQECIGLKCYETFHGLDCAPDFCPHTQTCLEGTTHVAEMHEPRLGGAFLVSNTPLFNTDGKVFATVHVARDITERKQAEQALRQAHDELEQRVQQRTEELALANAVLARTNQELVSEIAQREQTMAELRLASAALEAAANGIFITERDGKIRWSNPAFSTMTGYSSEEILGQSPRFLNSGVHTPQFYQQMWDTILSGQVWRGEITNRRKDGSTYIEDQTITPILDAEGKIANFIAIKRDISERIQSELELIQTNELLERFFSSIDTLIAYMDRDFNFIRVNEAYAKSAGHTAEFFLGKNHFALYPHAENQVIFQRVVETGEPFSVFEKPFEYPDHPEWGVTFWDWSLQPVMGSDGVVEGLVLSLVDVTGRKRAEDELARQNQDLLAFSQVEHELREFAESLAQSAISLNTSLELEQVLATILEQIHRVIPFSAADILLREGRSYRVAGTLNTYDEDMEWPPPGMSHSLDDFPLLDQMFTTLQPLLIANLDGKEEWQRAVGLEWVRSYVGAPLVAADQVFGVINLHSDQPGAFDQRTVERLMAYTAPAATAMQNAWLFEQVRSSRERLLALSRRLVEVQEGERRYIASELHDEVGQALTGLTLGLQLIDKKAGDQQIVRAEVAAMNSMLEGVLEGLHRLAMDLRPASLDHLGLATALRQHVAMVGDKYGLAAQFEVVGLRDRLPDEMEIAFYRMVQEALNNVVRHARARRVDVILEQQENRLVLIIEDDGVGFDPEATMRKSERLGLFGLRERAEMFGGKLVIESTAGKGTTIVVEVPYDNAHTDRG